jgi:hypothetical protein
MKYKVGDRVRLDSGELVDIRKIGLTDEVYGGVANESYGLYFLKSEISHIIISEITDELIDRFKKEKIAWHFKNKEDYSKMLYLLSNKGIGFHFAVDSPEEFFDKKKDFCLNLYSLKLHLQYGGLDYHVKDGFEIIEIMKPVYVPINLKIDDEWIDIDVIRFVENNLEPQYKDYKKQYYYKNQNIEVMFQQYRQQKKIPDLEKKIENQKVEIKNLHNKIDEMQKTLTYEMSYSKTLSNENIELKFVKEKMLKDLDKMTFQLGRIAGILDEDE